MFPIQNKSIEADSIVDEFDAQGNIVSKHYNNGSLISSVSSANQASVTENISYKVLVVEENKLSLMASNGETLDFSPKKETLVSSQISFLSIVRGIFGLVFLLLIAYLLSSSRKNINWKLVFTGVSLQIILAVLVLKVPFVKSIFDVISKGFVKVLSFTKDGSTFLFGNLVTDVDSMGFIFAFQILPTIVFFAALTSALYYLGIIQWVVYFFAWIMTKTMKLSGAESLAAAGNIFLGQTESPLLVRPYLEVMTKSEVMSLMTGGMATIAGGVLGAYVGYLGGDSIQEQQVFASHLLAASIMSAPAAIVAAKMLVPETEPEKIDTKLNISDEKIGTNILDAVSIGTRDGLKLAVNVGVMLLVFTAFMFMFNAMSLQIGEWTNLNALIFEKTDGRFAGLTLQYVLGLLFSPIAWILGVDWKDAVLVGQLLGEKTILNEFYAYATLGQLKAQGMFVSYKSIIIATYALCGFANFASIGIQIGGIGALAPNQQGTLASLGVKALIGGTIACFMTAAIAGMLY
jgi:CNT family concentrative nucleoside transporter